MTDRSSLTCSCIDERGCDDCCPRLHDLEVKLWTCDWIGKLRQGDRCPSLHDQKVKSYLQFNWWMETRWLQPKASWPRGQILPVVELMNRDGVTAAPGSMTERSCCTCSWIYEWRRCDRSPRLRDREVQALDRRTRLPLPLHAQVDRRVRDKCPRSVEGVQSSKKYRFR